MSYDTLRKFEPWAPLVFGLLFAIPAIAYASRISRAISVEGRADITALIIVLALLLLLCSAAMSLLAGAIRRREDAERRALEQALERQSRP